MKQIKALLFTANEGFVKVTLNGTLEDYYKHLNCTTMTGANVYDFQIFADDEALLKDPIPEATVLRVDPNTKKIIQTLHGNILFVNINKKGDTVSLTNEDIHEITSWCIVRGYFNATTMFKGKAIIERLFDQ